MSVVDVVRASVEREAGPSAGKKRASDSEWKDAAGVEALDDVRDLPNDDDDDAERPMLARYAYNFFAPELAQRRRSYLILLGRATLLTILLTWACLPIYWGSLSASAKLTGNLTAWLVNRDEGRLGESLVGAVHDAAKTGPGALGWQTVNASHVPSDEEVIQAVLNETIWLGVIVSTNASAALGNARIAGNASYDPTSAITVYYAQARNDVATGTFLIPAATSFLSNFTSTFATLSVQRYLATIITTNGTVNATALHNLAQAPQTLSPGVAYKLINLRPYAPPVSQAVLLVGQIYLCIFAFLIVMAHDTARDYLAPHLTFFSYLGIRIATPLLIYFPLSISVALVSLPFKLPFGGHFNYSTGFVTFWVFVYLSMAALGLALEAMITVLGRKFIPLFLVLWIVANISTAALPPELQPKLYVYGSGFPFWNIQQADRTLFFNTDSHLPKNAAVLIAWVLLSMGTLALFTWLVRYREARLARRRRRLLSHRPSGSRARSSAYSNSPGTVTTVEKASGKKVISSVDGSGTVAKERSQTATGRGHRQAKEVPDEKERGYRDMEGDVAVVPVCEV